MIDDLIEIIVDKLERINSLHVIRNDTFIHVYCNNICIFDIMFLHDRLIGRVTNCDIRHYFSRAEYDELIDVDVFIGDMLYKRFYFND